MRGRARVVAACAALALGVGGVWVAPEARAAVEPDGAAAAGIKLCAALYSRSGLDPSGLWARLNAPGAPRIVVTGKNLPVDGRGTKTGLDKKGNIRIVWDPTHDVTRDGITASPCETFYHELQHAADDVDNVPEPTLDEQCDGIPYAEWRAVGAQNAYRRALGLPGARSVYHGKTFGSGSFEECKKKEQQKRRPKKPRPTSPGGKKAGNGLFGDPHVTTTDGLLYDLQQIGEFTAFTSDDATAPRVQVRTARVGDSTYASLVSGVAAGYGDQRIAFVATSGALTITHGDAYAPTTVGEHAENDLGDGIVLSEEPSNDAIVEKVYTVQWADGSELEVGDGGYWGLRVSFTPSDAAATANPRGLLGTFDGDGTDDLTRPDGRVVPSASPAAVIRGEFGDAWRITDGESLFPYQHGQSTATFTDRAFPGPEPAIPPTVTDVARTVCQGTGVTADAMLEACVFDVSVTGEPALAGTAARVARDVSVTTVAGQPLSGTRFGSGQTVRGTVDEAHPVVHDFAARAGDVADVRSACTPGSRGVSYTVVAVDGALVEPLGIADACSDIGRVAFAVDGSYRLEISGAGTYAVTWRPTPGDQRHPISTTGPNSGHVATATRHSLRFTVAAGQRWTFTPEATCTQVPGFTWSVVTADTGALNERGITDACLPIGPLALAPGEYDLRIGARDADADYLFTAAADRGVHPDAVVVSPR